MKKLVKTSSCGPFRVPLRAAQEVWKLVDVFNGVFERLYLGEGLSPPAVVRRQVVTELVQSLCEAPHPHLLPLAGLHASFGGHLWLVLPLRQWWSPVSPREGKGKLLDLPTLAGVAHLWWRAHRIPQGLRWGGLMWLLVFSKGVLMALPLSQYFSGNHLQVHVRKPEDHAAGMAFRVSAGRSVWKWFALSVYMQKLISGGLKVHSCGVKKKKKFKETRKCQNATFPEDTVR